MVIAILIAAMALILTTEGRILGTGIDPPATSRQYIVDGAGHPTYHAAERWPGCCLAMPIRFSIPLVALALFVIIGLAAGRRESTGDPNVIKIVSSLPRSGSARPQTDQIVNGIKLAFKEVGNRVELTDPDTQLKKTYRVDFFDLDDATAAAGQYTIEQEIANANQARMDPDVMAYIGTYNSGAAKVSMPILNRANLLMVSPANTAERLTKPDTKNRERHEPGCYRPSGVVNYCRVVPTDDLQSELSALWIRDLGCKRIYVLDDNQTYGQGIANNVQSFAKRYGYEVLGHQSIDVKSLEFSSMMTTIKGLKPDLIYFGGTTQSKSGQLFKDMVKVGMTCPMMAPDGCFEQVMADSASPDVFEKAKFYATFGGLPIDALKTLGGRGAEFIRGYKAEYGKEPLEAYSSYGYECGLVVLEALRQAGKKDRDAIRVAALTKIKNFVGATGTWSFDAQGDTTNQTMSGNEIVVKTNENGERKAAFQFVKLLKK